MKIATAEEMRRIDKMALESYGIPEVVLMENAGVRTAAAVQALLGEKKAAKAVVFAGGGNNGGDAFAAARHLSNCGVKVIVYIVGDAERIAGAAKQNLEIVMNMNLDVMQVSSARDWDKVRVTTAFSDVLVDGLLGTGVHGALREDMEKMIRLINNAQKPVVSIDVPSGVQADTGAVAPVAVRAETTVSLGLPKVGTLLFPGASFVGAMEVFDIGIPRALLEDRQLKRTLIEADLVGKMLPERLLDVHKGRCGKVLVVAGQTGMTGAAALAGEAALRGGAGVVTVAAAAGLQAVLAAKLTEVMTRPLPETESGVLGVSALPQLLEMARAYDAVVIGPGLGRAETTQQLVRDFVAQTDQQLVVDADALYALRKQQQPFGKAAPVPVLTPHVGEMAVLLGRTAEEVQCDLIGTAVEAAGMLGAVVALKSARTIVADSEGNVYINTKGNPGMATAGSGDVLAGLVGALCAQGLAPHDAAVSGVYLHAVAGDLAAQGGMVGILSGDIACMLPAARLQTMKQRKM